MDFTATSLKDAITDKLTKYYATTYNNATPLIMYKAVALVLRDILLKKKQEFNQSVRKMGSKRVYYLCMEFLIGRSLKNNLYNLGLTKVVQEAISDTGITLDQLYDMEADAGLGNGGLGRLAACFMDSLASGNYPAMGFSIRYDYGFFKQKIVDNQQVELPDMWLDTGEVWMMPRSDKSFVVKLGGTLEERWDEKGLHVERKRASLVASNRRKRLRHEIVHPGRLYECYARRIGSRNYLQSALSFRRALCRQTTSSVTTVLSGQCKLAVDNKRPLKGISYA